MGDYTEYSLHCIVRSDKFYDQFESRLEDPNERDTIGETLLHAAAQSCDFNSRIVLLLLDRGADVDSKAPNGQTPLHYAVSNRKRDVVDALIEAGASVNSEDSMGRTALHFAIRNSWSKLPSPTHDFGCDMWIVDRLLGHPKAPINAVDQGGDTPMMWAVKERNSGALFALLKRGGNPNIANTDNRTPLHEALSARKPSDGIVLALLLSGADIYCEDNLRQTPVDILLQSVRNEETLSFAARCVWYIALKYQVRESLKRKLEPNPNLSDYLAKCCKEVRLMQGLVIHDNFTLHDFALDCVPAQVGDPVREIYIPVVEMLLSDLCFIYFNFVFCRLSAEDLRKVFERTTGNIHSFPSDRSSNDIFREIGFYYGKNAELEKRQTKLRSFLLQRI